MNNNINKLQLQKKYKAKDPKQTIIEIKNILHNIGIFIKEEHSSVEEGLHTSHVKIANEEFGDTNILTNGKGLTLSYSFASAYGEFMERLQNGVLFKNIEFALKSKLDLIDFCNLGKKLKEENLGLDFLYDPDEIIMDTKNLIIEQYEFISNLFDINNKDDLDFIISNKFQKEKSFCIPYFDYQNNKVVYLPQDLIFRASTSNGMCAGNTPEEALIQGICEIFERYALRKIYYSKITPPTIPYSYFKGTRVYELLNNIKNKYGYKIQIKDCSLNMKLPVIGILIVDPKNYSYNFKLAADPWPVTAVERCLTELYQNQGGMLKKVEVDYFDEVNKSYNKVSNKESDYINFENVTCYGTGKWPKSIFSNQYSYEFEGLEIETGLSDKTDLFDLINLVEKLGYNLYVRDVSFLNFPAYQIVIPGLSQTVNNKEGIDFFGNFPMNWCNFLRIKELNEHELKKMADAISEIYPKLKLSKKNLSRFFLLNDHPELKDFDIELFLSMAYYKLREYKESFFYINKFLEETKSNHYIYYYCIRDYLKLKMNNSNNIKEILSNIYNSDLVYEVINDLKYPENIFNYHNFPTCFGNMECEIKKNCRFIEMLKLVKRIQNIQKQNKIDQNRLSNVLYDLVIEEVE